MGGKVEVCYLDFRELSTLKTVNQESVTFWSNIDIKRYTSRKVDGFGASPALAISDAS